MFGLDAIATKLARLGKDPGAGGDEPRAAVAAILREGAEGVQLFFIRRADRVGDPWSGHIAFPGGRHEVTDETLLATAIRETREEVGIELDAATLVARLPDVPAFTRTKRGLLVVAPFVFALRGGEEPVVTPNHEVAETLWVPFAGLARGEGRGSFDWTWEGKSLELPCIRIAPAEHVLWGMTYRMFETILEALGPEDDTPGPDAR